MRLFPTAAICALCIAAFCASAFAQSGQPPVCASLTAANLTYNQNFDTLASSGTGNTSVPAGFGFAETGTNANSSYTASSGSSAGDTYSLGSSPVTDRAFGTVRSAGVNPTIGACFVNNTGSPITSFTVKYDGEMWYLATSGRVDRLDFQYSLDATSLTSGTWTDVNALDFITPSPGSTASPQNGNDPINRTAGITSTISALNIANGAKFYIRFQDSDVSGSDDGLAIDNFSLTATAAQPPGTFDFNSSSYSVNENAGTADLTINRTGGTNGPITVNYSFTNGTAIGGSACGNGVDFDNSTTSVAFADGESSKTISIPICDETLFELDETFSVSLTSAGAGSIGSQASATITIVNDDAPSSVQFSASSFKAVEGSVATITVTRSGDVSGTTSVSYASSDGTGTGGLCSGGSSDFEPSTGTLTFSAGETSKDVTVPVCGDLYIEDPAENLNLSLSNPVGGVIGTTSTATVVILDAATQFTSFSPMTVATGSSASPFPSTISVSGFTIPISGLRLTLFGVTSAQPENLQFLLVSPAGQHLLFMAGAGGTNALQNATVTLDDEAQVLLPDEIVIGEGKNYKPANCTANVADFAAPAPLGPYNDPGCSTVNATFASVFGGIVSDGNWVLYVRDVGQSLSPGIPTTISGWGLQFSVVTAAGTRIEGRVLTAKGKNIKNATVTISGGGLIQPKSVTTNGSGKFRLDGLTVNKMYFLTVEAKGYRFSQSGTLIKMQNTTELNFTAEP